MISNSKMGQLFLYTYISINMLYKILNARLTIEYLKNCSVFINLHETLSKYVSYINKIVILFDKILKYKIKNIRNSRNYISGKTVTGEEIFLS